MLCFPFFFLLGNGNSKMEPVSSLAPQLLAGFKSLPKVMVTMSSWRVARFQLNRECQRIGEQSCYCSCGVFLLYCLFPPVEHSLLFLPTFVGQLKFTELLWDSVLIQVVLNMYSALHSVSLYTISDLNLEVFTLMTTVKTK